MNDDDKYVRQLIESAESPRELAKEAVANYRRRQQPQHLTQAIIDGKSDQPRAAFTRHAVKFYRTTWLGRLWRLFR